MGERATKAQMIQRVDEVFRLLVDGLDTADILALVSEKHGVSEKEAAYYITKARKELNRLTEASRPEALRFVLENLQDVLKETRREKNYSCAIGALSQMAKVMGLERLVLEIPQDELPEVSEADAAKELAAESVVH